MSASQPALFNVQEFTDDGITLVGGRLYTYAFGTTAQKVAYTDPEGTVPQTYTADGLGGQYIALNARGELPTPLYLGNGSYDISLKRSDGTTVWTRKADGVNNLTNTFIALLASFLGSSLIGWISSAIGSAFRTVQDKLRDQTSLFDFMSIEQINDVKAGTKAINVGESIQAAWDWCVPRGIALHVPAGVYRIDAPLIKLSSFSAPVMFGENGMFSVFDFSNIPAGASSCYIQGGSGRLLSANWCNIGFKGNGTQIAIEIDGQCGMTFSDCVFSDLSGGFLFNNKTAGSFGEYLIADSCEFKSSCLKPIEYRKSSGDASFHGSGLRDCLVNGATGYPVVTVGDGCFPYNSPLSLQLWPQGGPVILVQHNGTNPNVPAIFHGSITLEPSATKQVVLGQGPGNLLMDSTILSVNENWTLGTARLCEHITLASNGQLSLLRRPYTSSATPVVNGGGVNVDLTFNRNAGIKTGMLLHITARGANYRWSTLGIATMASGQGGANTFTKICDTVVFNTSGWGAPTYSLDANGFVVVTNASSGFSVTLDIAVSQLGYNIG
ncbi:hypothetical protein [Janthinobacterium sp. PAMC25594]|uniref:hypothetical protein n=1 Tax=Janthinobacterium sp. PAMC25594 TaxID=2861284 RepID=UPI001C62D335|nr:hypothetical protein [Janthinobacterium sp. PAMC25594]QYG07120.1 hypothetical protein KY494_28715 [Janthinobacterium sp. PAMC25594]